jgi:hypothetical protein
MIGAVFLPVLAGERQERLCPEEGALPQGCRKPPVEQRCGHEYSGKSEIAKC